jgi:hypothetical protein
LPAELVPLRLAKGFELPSVFVVCSIRYVHVIRGSYLQKTKGTNGVLSGETKLNVNLVFFVLPASLAFDCQGNLFVVDLGIPVVPSVIDPSLEFNYLAFQPVHEIPNHRR